MAQTDNPFLDGVAKAFTDAAGMAQSVRAEIDTFVRQRLERLVADMDFVPREEFEAVKAMAAKARLENEALAARLAEIESKIPKNEPGLEFESRHDGCGRVTSSKPSTISTPKSSNQSLNPQSG